MPAADARTSLESFCLTEGADLFGIADMARAGAPDSISEHLRPALHRAISLGVRLSSAVLADIDAAPTRLYFHHYKTTNVFLDQLALKVTHFLERRGFRALAVPASQILDWQRQTAHLSHKHIGRLAGLGWIGRNNLLVNKKLGSQFRLATVLTDMPLAADEPLQDDCGVCRACVSLCPASAIAETPGAFDHQKCFLQLKEFQRQKLTDQYICGVCVKACRGTAP